jgi:hypothetical protein
MTQPTKPPKPPGPPTTRRNEVEQARRTVPVHAARSRLQAMADGDAHIKLLAEALRRLLHQP